MNVNNMLKKFKRKFKEIGEDSEEVEEIRRKKPKNLTVEDITPLPDVTVIYSNETASKGVVKNVKNFNFIKSNVSNYVVNPFYKRKKFDDDHHNLNHNNNNNNYYYCKVDDMNGGHQFLQGREIREKKKYNTRYQASTVKKKNFGVKNLNPVVLLHRIVMPEPEPEPEPPAAAIESFEKIFDRTKFASIQDLMIDWEKNRRKPTKILWENNYYVCNVCSCKFGSRSEVEFHMRRHF